jgi:hypothetical protein
MIILLSIAMLLNSEIITNCSTGNRRKHRGPLLEPQKQTLRDRPELVYLIPGHIGIKK